MYTHSLLSGHVPPYTLPQLAGNVPMERQTITVFSGDDNVIPWVIYQDGSPTSPQDITGWSITLLLKANAWDDDRFALFSVPGVLSDAPNGHVNFTVTSRQTRLMEGFGSYVLRGIDTSGRHRTLAVGVAQSIVS